MTFLFVILWGLSGYIGWRWGVDSTPDAGVDIGDRVAMVFFIVVGGFLALVVTMIYFPKCPWPRRNG